MPLRRKVLTGARAPLSNWQKRASMDLPVKVDCTLKVGLRPSWLAARMPKGKKMKTSRRNFTKSLFAASSALIVGESLLAAFSEKAFAATAGSTTLQGVIATNDPMSYMRFTQWFGKKPPLAMLNFNQTSPTAFKNSIPYIVNVGKAYLQLGARVLWSVPFPGKGQLEAINAGNYDQVYLDAFKSILAIHPTDNSQILVRLPWEFNILGQENMAKDKNGVWASAMFIAAWRKIATLARQVSPRFQRIWCPNVCTQNFDPIWCWPGPNYVDIVSQDFYMQKKYNLPGAFTWFLNEKRGLLWGKQFAAQFGKPYAISEWGMDDNMFINDFNMAALWLKGLGNALHHHCWWDRPEVIDCRISDGNHPQIGAAYKAHFF
jgi:hypothetical protein